MKNMTHNHHQKELMSHRLKLGVRITQKGPLRYQRDEQGRPIRFRPRLGDALVFLYDFFMAHSVFPNKFKADQNRHQAILAEALASAHHQRVLELGTGSGRAAGYLPPDNHYTGSDISAGLLRIAAKHFRQADFQAPAFYLASGDDLPFAPGSFDLCLCILSLNFIGNVERVFKGVHEVLVPGGRALCVVPIPERSQDNTLIQGTRLTAVRLHKLCGETGFTYERIDRENGALLYFWAIKPAG